MNKKAESTAESVQMMYRLFVIFTIAFIILGLGAFIQGVYINTRDSEAELLISNLKICIIEKGVINLDNNILNFKDSIVDYCKISNLNNFYVKISISYQLDNGEKQEILISQGDSGKEWIQKVFSRISVPDRLKKYIPGYTIRALYYPIIYQNKKINSNILMEVFIFDDKT